MPALLTDGVSAGYGRAPIINDISLSAELGSVTTIIGPNGAGKSTFAKTLVGILKPMSGRIFVNDVDITAMPGHQIPRHGLVYVPQNDNVFKRLTVRENLEVGGFASKSDTSARMEEILGIFTDLAKATEKKAGFLSGGQQNLLAIARALMVDPSVIILDEPTAGLSPTYTHVVWDQIARDLGTRHCGGGRRAERRASAQALGLRAHLRGGTQPRPRAGERDRRARSGVDLPREVAGQPVARGGRPVLSNTGSTRQGIYATRRV